MTDDPLDLTGHWSGDFSYPGGAGPTTPFVAVLEDRAGRISGAISEHDLLTGRVIDAVLGGTRSGSALDFTKTYGSNASEHYANPVDYVGRVSTDGLTISGIWSLLDWDGSFVMHRDAAAGAPAKVEDEVSLDEPVESR